MRRELAMETAERKFLLPAEQQRVDPVINAVFHITFHVVKELLDKGVNADGFRCTNVFIVPEHSKNVGSDAVLAYVVFLPKFCTWAIPSLDLSLMKSKSISSVWPLLLLVITRDGPLPT